MRRKCGEGEGACFCAGIISHDGLVACEIAMTNRRAYHHVRRSEGRLCLSQIKSGHIGDAVRPGWATKNVAGAIDGARDRCIFLQG